MFPSAVSLLHLNKEHILTRFQMTHGNKSVCFSVHVLVSNKNLCPDVSTGAWTHPLPVKRGQCDTPGQVLQRSGDRPMDH